MGYQQLIISIIVAVVTASLTSFFTHRLSRLADYRQGMKDIDESFYKPLISLFWTSHHSYAYFFVELPMDTQDEIMKLLLANKKRVPPWIEEEIDKLDQCYSGYSASAFTMPSDESGRLMKNEDKEFVEVVFQKIFTYIEEQYKSNERKLYHGWRERGSYRKYERKNM